MQKMAAADGECATARGNPVLNFTSIEYFQKLYFVIVQSGGKAEYNLHDEHVVN